MKPLFDLSTLRNAAVRLVQRSSSFCLSRLWAMFADRGGMAGDDRHNPRRARPQSLPRDSMTPKDGRAGRFYHQVMRENPGGSGRTYFSLRS